MRITALCMLMNCGALAAQPVTVTTRDPNLASIHGTKTRASAADYTASAVAFEGKAIVAAEFMGRTVPGERTTFLTEHYIVIEVAIYPRNGQYVAYAGGDFQLRINGHDTLLPDSPQTVAASLKYPDWSGPGSEVDATVYNTDIRIGGQAPVQRFPGDPRTANRIPRKDPQQKSEAAPLSPQDAPEAAVFSSLPEGSTAAPISGVLYFLYRGKLKGLKSLELLVRDGVEKRQILKIR